MEKTRMVKKEIPEKRKKNVKKDAEDKDKRI